MQGRDFLSLQDFSAAEIRVLLALAKDLKSRQKKGGLQPLLAGKTLAMIFEKPSTRTRISFEVGMWQLGGTALFLSSQELQMGRGEPIKDTAAVLSRYVDGIMIRTFDHAVVQELARYASVPVVNGLTDLLHPCQILADLLTIEEKMGRLQGVKVAYTGDGNNVAHSLLLGCSKMGLNLAVATPPSHRPLPGVVAQALANAEQSGSKVFITNDPLEAVKNADVIYTDVWTSMGQEKEQAARRKIFAPYQINSNLVKTAGPEALIMHCLPAYRGEEITAQVLEGKQSVVLDQAENRLHAQKALLALLMGTARG
ncbi:MAG: ornithine carbamoyltransferase [Firmicutes bacterium]|nr:ornithine carbamoyltransferase [Bacillota bacterium]